MSKEQQKRPIWPWVVLALVLQRWSLAWAAMSPSSGPDPTVRSAIDTDPHSLTYVDGIGLTRPITRSRKLVVLVGTQKALAIAVKNMDARRRVMILKQRLESK